MKPLVALYSSVPQSGKSEVAKVLTNSGYWTVKFADPLKNMVRALLASMGIDKETIERMVEGDLKEEVIPGFDTVTTRHLMQTLGTDWGREAVQANLWVNVAMAKADKLVRLGSLVIIDDLRFPNEYVSLRERGAFLVRINRLDAPEPKGGKKRYDGLLDDHQFDLVIENNSSLPVLHARAWDAILGASL